MTTSSNGATNALVFHIRANSYFIGHLWFRNHERGVFLELRWVESKSPELYSTYSNPNFRRIKSLASDNSEVHRKRHTSEPMEIEPIPTRYKLPHKKVCQLINNGARPPALTQYPK
jgi:hypothetical protein